jgi:hypothetical protein
MGGAAAEVVELYVYDGEWWWKRMGSGVTTDDENVHAVNICCLLSCIARSVADAMHTAALKGRSLFTHGLWKEMGSALEGEKARARILKLKIKYSWFFEL